MEEIIKLLADQSGNTEVVCADKEKAVKNLANHIVKDLTQGKHDALDLLFSVTVHVLAMEPTGNFAKEYTQNLIASADKYRKGYKEEFELIQKANGIPS